MLVRNHHKENASLYLFVIATTIVTIFFIMSCSPSKKTTSTDSNETKAIIKTDTIIKLKTDTVHVIKTEIKTDTKTDVVFDTLFLDKLCPPNKIVYKASGDVEVTGNITKFNLEKSVFQKIIDSLSKKADSEKQNSSYWENEVKKLKESSTIKRGIPVIFWVAWSLFSFILLLVGIFLGVRFRSFFTRL